MQIYRHRKLYRMLLVLIISFSSLCAEDEEAVQTSYLITHAPKQVDEKQPSSRRGLKEAIGETMHTTLATCAEVNKSIGALQIELGAIQKKILDSSEPLLENQPPYKNATKPQLRETLDHLTLTLKKLRMQVRIARILRCKLAQDELLKEAAASHA